MIEYLYYTLCSLSFILIFLALQQYQKTKYFLDNGIKANAEVIDLIKKNSDDGYTYKPVFEYTDKSNKRITFESEISSKPASHQIGEVVRIVYLPNNEGQKIISFWGLYRWTLILLSIASPMLIIGGGYLLFSRN